MTNKELLIALLDTLSDEQLERVYNYLLKVLHNPDHLCDICGSPNLEQLPQWAITKLYCLDCGAIK